MSVALKPWWRRVATTPVVDLIRGKTGPRWRQVVESAGLPEAAAAAVITVVERSRLWSGEQAAVAEELVAHFADGLESGRSLESLVASFGDPTQAAKLVRRAKVRGRPLAWRVWWWITRAAPVVAAVYLAYGFYLMSPRPTATDSFLSAVNAPIDARPEQQKAWRDYARLLRQIEAEQAAAPPGSIPFDSKTGLMGRLRDYAHAFGFYAEPPQTPGQQSELEAWLDAHATWLAELREASRKPSLGLGIGPANVFPAGARALFGYRVASDEDLWDGSQFSALHPQRRLRELADWLLADGKDALRQGDADRFVANVSAILGLSRQAREPATLLDTLIAERIAGMAIEACTDVLRDSPETLTADQWRDLAHAFAAVESDAGIRLNGEEAGGRDLIDRLFAGERLSLEGLQTFGEDIDKPEAVVAALQAARPEMRGLAEGFADDAAARLLYRVQAAAVMPWVTAGVTRSEALRDLQRVFQAARDRAATPLWASPPSVDAVYQTLPPPRRGVAELAGVWDGFLDRRRRATGELDGVLIGIALELGRREAGGEWPESLEELTPHYLPEPPIDLINGGPLGYRLVDGEPVVYSRGVDGDDDLGRLPSGMDDKRQERLGFVTLRQYRVRPPLREPLRSKKLSEAPAFYDGDWVLWSMAEPRYMPEPD